MIQQAISDYKAALAEFERIDAICAALQADLNPDDPIQFAQAIQIWTEWDYINVQQAKRSAENRLMIVGALDARNHLPGHVATMLEELLDLAINHGVQHVRADLIQLNIEFYKFAP